MVLAEHMIGPAISSGTPSGILLVYFAGETMYWQYVPWATRPVKTPFGQ